METNSEDSAFASALAATIRGESAKLGLKAADMSKATGIPSTTYWQIQREGGRAPKPTQLRKIARALGLTPGALYDLAEDFAAEMLARHAARGVDPRAARITDAVGSAERDAEDDSEPEPDEDSESRHA